MAQPEAIPTYKLYGEDAAWPTPELLHHESIAERSVIHNWKIRPHRHHDLFQILYIRRGSAHIHIDGREQDAVLPCLVLAPPLCVHGFGFTEDIDGHVLTLPDFALDRFFSASTGLRQRFGQPQILPGLPESEVRELDSVFRQLAEEFNVDRPGRLLALESLLGLILVRTARLLAGSDTGDAAIATRTLRHLHRFREMIARDYRRWRSIEDYASSLGITTTRLNDICRDQTGRSALQLVHDRVMLEAKRNLIYTVMTVSEIAYSLGFTDPAYFSRFFSRRAGCSPSEFRARRAAAV
jgi:AraC family transcriptional activator of pobA